MARPPQERRHIGLEAGLVGTVKEAAELWGVSERTANMLRTVQKLRPDLAAAAADGEIAISSAYRTATGRDSTWERLVQAWNKASDEEREQFCQELGLGR
jgi:hypothetical protein